MMKPILALILLFVYCIQAAYPGEVYKYQTFEELERYIKNLAVKYPKLMKLETAQEKYNLPYPECKPNKCPIYIMTLTEFETLSPDRPQVFFSGAIHGDEVIGPNAVTYYANYLLKGYGKDKWLTYLLQNRVIVIMPAANAKGYTDEFREEMFNGTAYDPNRDFPYNNDIGDCMNTLTARSILRVVKDHVFRIGVTFHGGTNAIGYEWGSNNHVKKDRKAEECPDDVSMAQVGLLMQEEAGETTPYGIIKYELGRMTDVVYSAAGAMEDWAYASSWANTIENKTYNLKCNTTTYGGFDNKELEIGSNTLRFPLYLVETDDDKHPNDTLFGREEGILRKNTTDDGHVPRNIRLSLAVTDLAQPYIRDINLTNHDDSFVKLTWKIGGALYVNETYVEWDYYDGTYPESVQTMTNSFSDYHAITAANRTFSKRTEKLSGKSIWLNPNGEFSALLPLNNETKRRFVLRIAAKTDLQWAFQKDPNPKTPALTHFARLRLQESYVASENHSVIYSPTNTVFSQILILTTFEYKDSLSMPISVFASIVSICLAAAIIIPIIVCLYFRRRYRNYESMV